jgi:hypothetical protein
MANSKTIAGLIGPTLIALAAALFVNLGSTSALVEPVVHDPALVLVSGVLSFVWYNPHTMLVLPQLPNARGWPAGFPGDGSIKTSAGRLRR